MEIGDAVHSDRRLADRGVAYRGYLLRLSCLTSIPSVAVQGDALLVTYMRDVSAILQLRSLASGVLVRELPMPGYGNVKELCARQSLSELYYSYESLTDAGSTFT